MYTYVHILTLSLILLIFIFLKKVEHTVLTQPSPIFWREESVMYQRNKELRPNLLVMLTEVVLLTRCASVPSL